MLCLIPPESISTSAAVAAAKRRNMNTYEGLVIGYIDDIVCDCDDTVCDCFYTVTESSIRPPDHRFEASRQDGEVSLFGSSIEDLQGEIDNKIS